MVAGVRERRSRRRGRPGLAAFTGPTEVPGGKQARHEGCPEARRAGADFRGQAGQREGTPSAASLTVKTGITGAKLMKE